jgi:hypothetical protein
VVAGGVRELVDWLVDWLVDSLVDWLVDWEGSRPAR